MDPGHDCAAVATRNFRQTYIREEKSITGLRVCTYVLQRSVLVISGVPSLHIFQMDSQLPDLDSALQLMASPNATVRKGIYLLYNNRIYFYLKGILQRYALKKGIASITVSI